MTYDQWKTTDPADEKQAEYEAAIDRFTEQLGRVPDDDEIQALLEMEYDADCAAREDYADAERERQLENEQWERYGEDV